MALLVSAIIQLRIPHSNSNGQKKFTTKIPRAQLNGCGMVDQWLGVRGDEPALPGGDQQSVGRLYAAL